MYNYQHTNTKDNLHSATWWESSSKCGRSPCSTIDTCTMQCTCPTSPTTSPSPKTSQPNVSYLNHLLWPHIHQNSTKSTSKKRKISRPWHSECTLPCSLPRTLATPDSPRSQSGKTLLIWQMLQGLKQKETFEICLIQITFSWGLSWYIQIQKQATTSYKRLMLMVVQLILKWSVLTLWQCPIDMLLWLAISRNPGGNLIEKICAGPNTWCKNGIEGKFQVKWFDTRLVSAEWLQNFGAFSCLSARLFSWTTTGVKYCITNQTTHAWGPDGSNLKASNWTNHFPSKMLPYCLIIAVPSIPMMFSCYFNLHSKVEPWAVFPDWLLLKAILILIWFRNMYFSWKCDSRKQSQLSLGLNSCCWLPVNHRLPPPAQLSDFPRKLTFYFLSLLSKSDRHLCWDNIFTMFQSSYIYVLCSPIVDLITQSHKKEKEVVFLNIPAPTYTNQPLPQEPTFAFRESTFIVP